MDSVKNNQSSSSKSESNIFLSIAEFDIDKGPTVRAELPYSIPVTSPYLSTLASSSSSSSSSPSVSWTQFLADQMMPDGSDRNARNTSWVFLNRPPAENGLCSSSGIVTCVFQFSTSAKWEARACILAVLKKQNDDPDNNNGDNGNDDDDDDEGTLCLVDFFDFVKNSPTFSFSKQNIDPYFSSSAAASENHYVASPTSMMSGGYKPIGKISSIEIQAIASLPSEKMNKVVQVCNRPPIRPPKQESSFFQFLSNNNADSYLAYPQQQQQQQSPVTPGNGNSNNSTSTSSSNTNNNQITPKAAANLIGEYASCGVAFLSDKDLEKLVSWINFAKTANQKRRDSKRAERSSGDFEQEDDDEENNNDGGEIKEEKCDTLYGNVVTVTKKMDNARRGSVNLSVCVCSPNVTWLYLLRPFLETVAVACCDATGASSAEEKLARIQKIAESAYTFLTKQIIPILLLKQNSRIPKNLVTESLSALSKRITLRDYSEWFSFLNNNFCDHDDGDDNTNLLRWIDPNNKNLFCDCTHQILPLQFAPRSPLLILDPSSTTFTRTNINVNNSNDKAVNGESGEDSSPGMQQPRPSPQPQQHAPQESFHNDQNHLISTLIDVIGTDGLCRVLVHILLQRRCLVICRGGGGSRATEAVMAIASLFEFFDDRFLATRVIPYASVSLLDAIQSTRGVLAGTVNPIFETRFGVGVDVIVDLDCKCVKFGGVAVSSQQQQQQSGSSSSSSSSSSVVVVYDCYNNNTSANSSSSSSNNINNAKNFKNNNNNISDIAKAKQEMLLANLQQNSNNNSNKAAMTAAMLMGATVTETKNNLTAVCAGSIILEKWCDGFAKDLNTLLLRRLAAETSYGGAMMTTTTTASIPSHNKTGTTQVDGNGDDNETFTISFNNNNASVEDEVRLMIIRELSYLMWSLSRSCSPFCEVPLRLAESRIYFLGRWLGRHVPDEITFGMQLSRLMLPLCSSASSSALYENYSNYFNLVNKEENLSAVMNNNNNNNFQQQRQQLQLQQQQPQQSSSSSTVNSLAGAEIVMDKATLINFHGSHLIEEELIVSFLQHSVRLTAGWKAQECLMVTAYCPRSLQILATLCGHKSSVIRLLAAMLLNKLIKVHPTIEKCAARELNMFLHFVVDAARMEFKAQLL